MRKNSTPQILPWSSMLMHEKKYLIAIFLIFFMLVPVTVMAVPGMVTYQGKLTNADGTPVDDGSYDICFSIYNVAFDGTALWSETHSVSVIDGIYNVTLGTVTPIPTTILDNPALYLGVQVETDPEMTPRLDITSTFYALKAGDADTVGGMPSDEIVSMTDLKDHAYDPDAHHSKTTSFSELTDQIADSQIPASITRDSEFNAALKSHAANSSAHHVRFSAQEAVIAMGKKEDKNPLNHDRYSDIEAVKAVLANDGPGSDLDADLLDGQHAVDIIRAADTEVRTEISHCGITITSPGSYYLSGNLSCTGHGVTVSVNNVTIDFMGFTITGDGGADDYGVYIADTSNVELKNGTVTGFGKGVYATNAGNSIRVINLRVMNNDYGMHLVSKGNSIKQCSAADNQSYGIFVGSGSVVINNTAYGNSNTGMFIGRASTIIGNTAYDNGFRGIEAGTGSTLTDNMAYSNGGGGITAGTGSTIVHNSSSYNENGIEASSGSNLSDNSCFENDRWGIFIGDLGNFEGETRVTNNSITYNNLSDISGLGGLRIPSNCYVKGNSVSFNKWGNICVKNSHNMIEDNLVTNSTNGIVFNNSGNFYANNRASANTNNFVNTTGQTNGGGNYSF